MKELPKLGSKWLTNKGVVFTVERINYFSKCENTITFVTPSGRIIVRTLRECHDLTPVQMLAQE